MTVAAGTEETAWTKDGCHKICHTEDRKAINHLRNDDKGPVRNFSSGEVGNRKFSSQELGEESHETFSEVESLLRPQEDIPETETHQNSETEIARKKTSATGHRDNGRSLLVNYESAVWLLYGSLTVLATIDRFTWNVWPRQSFRIGSGYAGKDQLIGFKPGPWSVVVYDVFARISGRFCIMAYNLLLVTRMRSLQNFLPSSFVGKYLLDCRNIVNANNRLHTWNAIALVAVTILHVWSILLPCVTHGWAAQVVPVYFEWILSERKPEGFKDADPETETMSMQVDDVFRLVEMTILLGLFIPLSCWWLTTKWHIGIKIHRWVNAIYFVGKQQGLCCFIRILHQINNSLDITVPL
jgi:hypothetical protein